MIFRTVSVEAEFDLNSVCRGDGMLFVRNGIGIAGRGTAATVPESEVRNFLSTLLPSQQHAAAMPLPLMFGLVPFLPSEPATFVLPRATFRKHPDGSRTITLVGENEKQVNDAAVTAAINEAVHSNPPRPSGNSYRVEARTPIGRYLDAVTAARDAVRSGVLKKAVIARDIEVFADDPLDVHGILLRLRSSFGSSYRYCINNMLGASPELLIEIDGRTVRSHPLAGTAPRTGDPVIDARLADELIASTKNQVEHRVVIDMVHDTLLPHCSYLDWEAEPSIVTVANVQHLGTAIEGALAEPAPHILTLVRELCPTPALGGFPSAQAIDFITANEGMVRGNYGGAVGWMDATGNGCFAVTIRCAELSSDRRAARLFAGGGIVAESDPYSELAETQAKFQAMLSAIIRP
jgi:isochorismate synthase